MTSIGLQYLQHQEQSRHNARMEAEQARANDEIQRSNLAREAYNMASLEETERSNREKEYNERRSIASRLQGTIYTARSQAANVKTSTQSSERISDRTLQQREKESVREQETAFTSSGLRTLTDLATSLLGKIKSTKRSK